MSDLKKFKKGVRYVFLKDELINSMSDEEWVIFKKQAPGEKNDENFKWYDLEDKMSFVAQEDTMEIEDFTMYGVIKIKPEWCISYGRDYDYYTVEESLDDNDFLQNMLGIRVFFSTDKNELFRIPLIALTYDMEEVYKTTGVLKEEMSKFTFSENSNITVRVNKEELCLINDDTSEIKKIINYNYSVQDIYNICASIIRYCKNVKSCTYEVIMDRDETISYMLQLGQSQNTQTYEDEYGYEDDVVVEKVHSFKDYIDFLDDSFGAEGHIIIDRSQKYLLTTTGYDEIEGLLWCLIDIECGRRFCNSKTKGEMALLMNEYQMTWNLTKIYDLLKD